MAKKILWFYVITYFILAISLVISGEELSNAGKLVFISCVGILALCEAIEKHK